MKIKHLIIVSLLLAILTLGAVCASDNVTGDDLTIYDDLDGVESPVNDVEIDDGDVPIEEVNDEILKDYSADDSNGQSLAASDVQKSDDISLLNYLNHEELSSCDALYVKSQSPIVQDAVLKATNSNVLSAPVNAKKGW